MKKKIYRSDNPDPVDIHVGGRVRMRRTLLGLSQDQLGKTLGLTFQQVQKYEKGINRMGASRLYQIGGVLNVSVSWFYEGLEPTNNNTDALSENVLNQNETLELVRNYYSISDEGQRKAAFEMIKALASD